jgi:RNA polymerase sigma factor (sigma-70 family)
VNGTTISAGPPRNPEHLTLLSEVLRDVSRRRLSADEAEDFIQSAHLKLLERDYDIFDRFAGGSSLRTYLTVVVVRLLLDWRNSTYGKWRPSAVAVRLGEDAVRLERLIYRDGYSADEAIETLRLRPDALSVPELWRLRQQLPPRPRPRTVSDVAVDGAFNTRFHFQDPVLASEERHREGRIRAALAKAIEDLPADDRRLIVDRFGRNRTVQSLAHDRHDDPKALYRRFARILQSLRNRLVQLEHVG